MIESLRSVSKDWKLYVIISSVFAFTMAFVNDKNAIYAIVFILLVDVVIIRRRISFGYGDLILFFASLSYGLIWESEVTVVIVDVTRIVALFQLAKYLAAPCDSNEGITLNVSSFSVFNIIILSFALFIKGILNYSYVIFDHSLLGIGMWPACNAYWSIDDLTNFQGRLLSHSQHQFYIVLMSSLLLFFVEYFRRNRVLGVVGICLSLTALWMGALTRGKLGFVCSAVAILASLIVLANDKNWFKNKLFWIGFAAVSVGSLTFALILKRNAFGIYDFLGVKIWSHADAVYYSERFFMMRQAITILKDHPMGGYNDMLVEASAETGPYACNSWLIIAVNAGVIPALLFLCFLIMNTLTILFYSKKCNSVYKYALISSFTGMSMYHMLESAFIGDFRFWMCEVFLGGIVYGMNESISENKGIVIYITDIIEKLS